MYLKLTVTATGYFYSAPKDNTARCLLQLYDDNDQMIRGYVVGVRCGSEDITNNLKSQEKRVESFIKFFDKNKDYFHFGYKTLYKPDVTEQEFDNFVTRFEKKWGQDQTQAYNFLYSNCAVAVESVINHFFPNETIANNLYFILRVAPIFLSYCGNNLLPIALSACCATFLKPGWSLPAVYLYNCSSNPIAKANMLALFSSNKITEKPDSNIPHPALKKCI